MQAELDRREQSNLQRVITLLSRPVRIVKGQNVSNTVDETLFETEEEKVLHAAAEAAASHIRPDMSIPDFLQVRHPSLPSRRRCLFCISSALLAMDACDWHE